MSRPALTPAQHRDLAAAVSSLMIHGGACGHRRHYDECGYCDDRAIALRAKKALRTAPTDTLTEETTP